MDSTQLFNRMGYRALPTAQIPEESEGSERTADGHRHGAGVQNREFLRVQL